MSNIGVVKLTVASVSGGLIKRKGGKAAAPKGFEGAGLGHPGPLRAAILLR